MKIIKSNKRQFLLFFEILTVIFLLFTCIGSDELQEVYYGEDMAGEDLPAGSREIETEPVEMSAGVYRIHVSSRMSGEENISLNIVNHRGYTDTLRENSLMILAGNDEMDFDFYLTDTCYEVALVINFEHASLNDLYEISVWKTKEGNRILLFLVAGFYLLLDALLYFRYLCVNDKITFRQRMVVVSLAGLAILQFLPYWNNSLSLGDDLLFHLMRVESLADAIKQGESFPYWITPYWLSGHGYATTVFYSNLFIFIPALLRVCGFSIMTAYKIFVFVLIILTTVIAYLSFYKCVEEKYAALLGTMLYVLAPYRFTNYLLRGSVGEYLAMSFLPLVFCGFYLLYTRDTTSPDYKKHKWWIVVGMTGILESHLLTTELVIVFLFAFCVLLVKKTFRKQTFIQLAEASGIALAWNCWFYLPMLYMLQADTYKLQANMVVNWVYGLDAGNNLVVWWNRANSVSEGGFAGRPYSIGIVILVCMVCWAVNTGVRKKKINKVCLVLAVTCIVGLFMVTDLFPWDAIQNCPGIGPMVAVIQFPYRLLGIVSVFGSAFVAFAVKEWVEEDPHFTKKMTAGIALMSLFLTVYQLEEMVATDEKQAQLYVTANAGTSTVMCGEYMLTMEPESEFTYHEPETETGLQWCDYEKHGTSITITVENTSEREQRLELPLQGYQGYQAVDAAGTEIGIAEEKGTHGDLTLLIPAKYEGTISVTYVGFPIFKVAEGVTIISVLISAGYFVYRGSNGRKREK